MSSNFAYNARDLKFILKEWLPTDKIFAYPRYADYYSIDGVDSILDPVMKICKELLEPASNAGSDHGVKFENGKVTTDPNLITLFKQIQSEGWGTANFDPSEDAIVLPTILLNAVWELMGAAYPAFFSYVTLTNGAFHLIESFGGEHLVKLFSEKMMSGDWAGTMCLTESGAGSDVGDISSKAYPTEDPRIFKIKGSKIFITGGDNSFTENVIHLYLARVEGARSGTAGISLFVVPKYWVNEDGSLEDNDVQTTGIEHKMGLWASATASLAMGENGNCRGWLVGQNPLDNDGRGEGMAQMFQMMNEARIETGHVATAVLANAIYNTRDYCRERIQGRSLQDPRGPRVPIIQHGDIRRALMLGKAHVDAMRAMIYKTYIYADILAHDPDPEVRAEAAGFIEVVTPMCKAYPTDEAWNLVAEAIQCYGGYGYCEEYPVSQSARDLKIYSIWEGTNFIQAQDLIKRKWTISKGVPYQKFIADIEAFCTEHKHTPGWEREFANLDRALKAIARIKVIIEEIEEPELVSVYARRTLTASSQLYAAYCILDQALLANRKAQELGPDHYDYNFYYGKTLAAKYYVRNVLPSAWNFADLLEDIDDSVLLMPGAGFDY